MEGACKPRAPPRHKNPIKHCFSEHFYCTTLKAGIKLPRSWQLEGVCGKARRLVTQFAILYQCMVQLHGSDKRSPTVSPLGLQLGLSLKSRLDSHHPLLHLPLSIILFTSEMSCSVWDPGHQKHHMMITSAVCEPKTETSHSIHREEVKGHRLGAPENIVKQNWVICPTTCYHTTKVQHMMTTKPSPWQLIKLHKMWKLPASGLCAKTLLVTYYF